MVDQCLLTGSLPHLKEGKCHRHILKVPVSVFPEGLENDSDDSHQRLHHTELESGLTETEKGIS